MMAAAGTFDLGRLFGGYPITSLSCSIAGFGELSRWLGDAKNVDFPDDFASDCVGLLVLLQHSHKAFGRTPLALGIDY